MLTAVSKWAAINDASAFPSQIVPLNLIMQTSQWVQNHRFPQRHFYGAVRIFMYFINTNEIIPTTFL